MRRQVIRAPEVQPSLVPLADLLANTVGVMVFIFIFTVLTAGGVSVPKRLPIEHASKLDFVTFVCRGNRVLPLDGERLVTGFLKPLGEPTFYTADEWVATFNRRKMTDPFFELTGEGSLNRDTDFFRSRISFDLTLALKPKEGTGDTDRTLARPDSVFSTALRQYAPTERFAFFVVYPDALQTFQAARNIAIKAGYGTGWNPQAAGEPVRFSINGSGHTPVPQ